MRSNGIESIAHDAPTSAIVTLIDTAVEKRNLAMSVRRIPSGAMPMIQMRLPSSEIWGKTKRVVNVARFSAHAPRFRYEVRSIQKSLVSRYEKWRRFTM